jgi:predicted component of type VI protein secretion system
MEDKPNPEESLADEIYNLGQNLIQTLHAAWDRPERKMLQQEIEEGLSDLAQTLQQEADSFVQSPTGQRMKSDLEELHQKVRTGEAETKIRSELLEVFKVVNTELQRVATRLQSEDSAPGEESNDPGQTRES